MRPTLKIIGDANIAAQYVDWAINQLERQERPLASVHTGDCLIELSKAKNYITFIAGTVGGVVMHPRTGNEIGTATLGEGAIKYKASLAGGWRGWVTPMEDNTLFPLADVDNASYLVSDPTTGAFLGDEGNYGNINWSNFDNSLIISYKGTPTRHFPLASAEISLGYDFIAPEGDGFYGTKIYQGGNVLVNAPKNGSNYYGIRGAAMSEETIVVITATGVYTASTSSIDGTFDALWTPLAGPELPITTQWFFNVSGTQAVSSDGDVLTLRVDSYSLTPRADSTIRKIVTDYNSMTYDGSMTRYSEFSGNALAEATIQCSGSFQTTIGGDNQTTYGDVERRMQYPPEYAVILKAVAGECITYGFGRYDGIPVDYPTICGEIDVSISGPVEKVGNCWMLSESCNNPGSKHYVTVTITMGGVTVVSDPREVFPPTHPGWWELVSCDMVWMNISTIDGGCTIEDRGQNMCDDGGAVLYATVDGNIKKEFSQYTTSWTHRYSPPIEGCRCNGTAGSTGGTVVSSFSETFSLYYWIYTPTGDMICNPFGKAIEGSYTRTTTEHKDVPWKTYVWTCA